MPLSTNNSTYPLFCDLDPCGWQLPPKETKRVGNKNRIVARVTTADGRRISFQLNRGKFDKLVALFGVGEVKDNGVTREVVLELPPDHELVKAVERAMGVVVDKAAAQSMDYFGRPLSSQEAGQNFCNPLKPPKEGSSYVTWMLKLRCFEPSASGKGTHVVKSDGSAATLDDIKPRSELMVAGHLSLWHMGMVNNKPKWGLQIDADHIEVTPSEKESGPSFYLGEGIELKYISPEEFASLPPAGAEDDAKKDEDGPAAKRQRVDDHE